HAQSCVPHRTLVCVGSMITIQRVWTHRILSMIDCCCSWIPSVPSAGRYACLVFVAPVCCYAHVVSDDRSYVVDRPTTSACSSLTMNPLVRSHIHSRVDSAPPSILPLEPSPCATQSQYIGFVSVRRPSPVTSRLPLPAPYRSTHPVPDVEDRTVADVLLYGIRRPALYCLWMTRHKRVARAVRATRRGVLPGGSILTRGHTARRGWMDGWEARVRRCVRRLCAGWMQSLRTQ
ncbi:hypothetical protein DFH08DRAFT_902771, partial [Mycena albidolilacea]